MNKNLGTALEIMRSANKTHQHEVQRCRREVDLLNGSGLLEPLSAAKDGRQGD